MKVTSISELKKVAKGEIIELPGWVDEEPFFARVGRPSLQKMVSDGTIPNSLLSAAMEIFYGKTTNNKVDMKQIVNLQECVVGAALLEPTLSDIEEAGISLTDQQMLAIFNYTQEGVSALERFRKKPTGDEDNKSESDI